MSKNWDYYDDKKNKIVIEPPKQTLRITGHRIAGILGLDPYTTPFMCWAEITKLAKPEIEDNKYFIMGRTLEPKLIAYIGKQLPNVMSIEEYYGNVFEEYKYNNFKDDSKHMGGIIDAVTTLDDKRTITLIIECKTAGKKHIVEWDNGNVPIAYQLQGALYAYMKHIDRVAFVCTFVDDIEYAHPETVIPTKENTIITIKRLDEMQFNIDGTWCGIEKCMELSEQWWTDHIDTGISPEFDEIKDKEYLDIIRKTDAVKDQGLEDTCKQAYELAREIKRVKAENKIDDMEKSLKSLETSIKNEMIDKGTSSCGSYVLRKNVKAKFDEDLFSSENADLYNKYVNEVESYTLTKKKDED